jgi:hypothetical protein
VSSLVSQLCCTVAVVTLLQFLCWTIYVISFGGTHISGIFSNMGTKWYSWVLKEHTTRKEKTIYVPKDDYVVSVGLL